MKRPRSAAVGACVYLMQPRFVDPSCPWDLRRKVSTRATPVTLEDLKQDFSASDDDSSYDPEYDTAEEQEYDQPSDEENDDEEDEETDDDDEEDDSGDDDEHEGRGAIGTH